MRVIKLLAYLALAIFLPIWLFYLSRYEIAESEKKNKKDTPSDTVILQPTTSPPTQINIAGQHLDSLFYFLAKSNVNLSPDINLSIPSHQNDQLEELTTLVKNHQEKIDRLLERNKDIQPSIPKIEITQPAPAKEPRPDRLPPYGITDSDPVRVWEVRFSDTGGLNFIRDKEFLILRNGSRKKNIRVNNIAAADTLGNIQLLNKTDSLLEPGGERAIGISFPKSKKERACYI